MSPEFMSPEFWSIIGVGVGGTSVVGLFFTFLNMRISDVRKGLRYVAKNLSEEIVRSEKRTSDRIDGLERRIEGLEKNMGDRIDAVEDRLRVVEHGQARVVGAVEMMQTIVVATLRGEEVSAD